MASPHPTGAEVPDDDNLVISWSDGRRLVYPMDKLRASCPCASCVDEWTGEVRVRREMFPGVTLRNLDEAGNYAFKMTFSDGHATGIYTYRLLREIGEPAAEEGNPFDV